VKIGEVATQAEVSVDTVRFYERVGVVPAPARTASGYRDYEPDVVDRIRLTRRLQAIGFTLADTVDALKAHDAGGATCESERWRLDVVLERVEARIAELNAVRDRIVETKQACEGGRCVLTSAR
jgi:MerR family mercuric resistance operon transcriptional regulator/MerR family copper efflux transcriptional regulator